MTLTPNFLSKNFLTQIGSKKFSLALDSSTNFVLLLIAVAKIKATKILRDLGKDSPLLM